MHIANSGCPSQLPLSTAFSHFIACACHSQFRVFAAASLNFVPREVRSIKLQYIYEIFFVFAFSLHNFIYIRTIQLGWLAFTQYLLSLGLSPEGRAMQFLGLV